MCYTYDKSRGGDTRELQSRMVRPPKKLGRVTLNHEKEAVIVLIDFKKAFDSIVRTKMLRILLAYGIPHQMVEAIKVKNENTSALVINRPVPHRHWSASR